MGHILTTRQRERATVTRPRGELPRWPITAMFVPFPLWWTLGFAEMVWVPIAGLMLILMIRRGGIRVPRGLGAWLLFLVLMALSVVGIDSFGRLIGFVYRALQYAAVTIAFVYVYNARRTITVDWLLGVLTVFWVYMVAGGWLGIVAPEFSFRTPLAYIVPGSLQQNELVGEMVVRRSTQWNPDAYFVQEPRPSAPFLYTNGWGNAYSLLLPLVLEYVMRVRSARKRLGIAVVLLLSLVPAILTLNRGMFLGLGVAVVYAIGRAIWAGRGRALLALLVTTGVGAAVAVSLGAIDRVLNRVETSSSTEDRANLYSETFTRTLQSPLFGYGAPRPSWTPGAPSAGTQGHVWTIMFSHGFLALALFLAALAWLAWATARATRGRVSAVHVIQIVLLVEVFYYGVLPHGLTLAFLPAAAMMAAARPGLPGDTPAPNGEHARAGAIASRGGTRLR